MYVGYISGIFALWHKEVCDFRFRTLLRIGCAKEMKKSKQEPHRRDVMLERIKHKCRGRGGGTRCSCEQHDPRDLLLQLFTITTPHNRFAQPYQPCSPPVRVASTCHVSRLHGVAPSPNPVVTARGGAIPVYRATCCDTAEGEGGTVGLHPVRQTGRGR
jgi:hypothetical protein